MALHLLSTDGCLVTCACICRSKGSEDGKHLHPLDLPKLLEGESEKVTKVWDAFKQDAEDRCSVHAKWKVRQRCCSESVGWYSIVVLPIAIVCTSVESLTWLSWPLWISFFISLTLTFLCFCVTAVRDDFRERILFKELEQEWEAKFNHVGFNLQRRFKVETIGSGIGSSTLTYRWIEIRFAGNRPRRDPDGTEETSLCQRCMSCSFCMAFALFAVGSIIGAVHFSSSLETFIEYYEKQPGTCTYGMPPSPGPMPTPPFQASPQALLNYRCDKLQASKCTK